MHDIAAKLATAEQRVAEAGRDALTKLANLWRNGLCEVHDYGPYPGHDSCDILNFRDKHYPVSPAPESAGTQEPKEGEEDACAVCRKRWACLTTAKDVDLCPDCAEKRINELEAAVAPEPSVGTAGSYRKSPEFGRALAGLDPATPPDAERERTLDRARKAAQAVYLATDAAVAKDISDILTQLIALASRPALTHGTTADTKLVKAVEEMRECREEGDTSNLFDSVRDFLEAWDAARSGTTEETR